MVTFLLTSKGTAWFSNPAIEYGQRWDRPDFYVGRSDIQRKIQTVRYGKEKIVGNSYYVPVDLRYVDPTSPLESLKHLSDTTVPETIVEDVRRGVAKILFVSLVEGTMVREVFEEVQRFMQRNKFELGDYYFLSSNLNMNSVPEDLREYVKLVPYFFQDLWFNVGVGNQSPEKDIEHLLLRDVKPRYRFAAMSRHPRSARSLTRLFLEYDKDLLENTILGFGGSYNGEWQVLGSLINDVETNARVEEGSFLEKVLLNLKGRDLSKPVVRCLDFDTTQNVNNSVTTVLNRMPYTHAFVNILQETYCPLSDRDINYPVQESIFFTEKLAKALYLCQPFLLVGNVGSLQELHRQGFKTFDRWWDESYDLEERGQDRVVKIFKVVKEIEKWSDGKVQTTLKEMESVLRDNAYRLLEMSRSLEIIEFLEQIFE